MNNEVNLLICTHKEFTPPVKNEVYKVLYGNHDIDMSGCGLDSYKCVSDDKLDDKFYSEIYMLKNVPDFDGCKYVGLCHYRRYFDFMDDIPDFDELFKEYECVLPRPLFMRQSVRGQYAMAHNVEDYDIVGTVIKDKYPEYYGSFIEVSIGKTFYPYNMFVMKKEDFVRYVKFISDVLDGYIEIVGDDIMKRVMDNADKYLNKRIEQNRSYEYQYRIGGYLAERLSNVFFKKNFKKVYTREIFLTEYKYKQEIMHIKQLKL